MRSILNKIIMVFSILIVSALFFVTSKAFISSSEYKIDKEKQKILPKSTHSKEKKKGYRKWVTVRKAIFDLPILGAGESYDDGIIKNHNSPDRKSTRLNSSNTDITRMPSSA